MKKYNVMIVDEQPLYRKGIIQVLNSNSVVQEIHEAVNGEQAITVLESVKIDIIFFHYISGIEGFETVKTFLTNHPTSRIIVISNVDSVAVILNFFKIGAKGFLHKTMDDQSLLNAIRTVSLNDFYYFTRFDEEINWWLKIGLEGKLPAIRLSEREAQIVSALSLGKTSKEMSVLLGLDIRTIETYRYDLLQKFGVRNAAELLTYLYTNAVIH